MPSTVQGTGFTAENKRHMSPPPLLARQHFSFLGTLLSPPAKGSLDIHSFSDDWCMIAIPRKSLFLD